MRDGVGAEGLVGVMERSDDEGGCSADPLGVAPLSTASRSRAVWIARRICDEVDDGAAELTGRSDLAVGRRAG